MKEYDINDYLNSLDGCFSLVFETDGFVLVAVDKICSIPLFYTEIGNTWAVDSHAPSLIKRAQITELNFDAILALKMSGYTEEELIGKTGRKVFLSSTDENIILEQSLKRLNGKSNSFELQVRNKKQELRHWLISGAPNPTIIPIRQP